MSKPHKQQDTHAPEHSAHRGQPPRETRKPDADEQHRKDQAPRANDAKSGDATSGRAKQKERLREVLR